MKTKRGATQATKTRTKAKTKGKVKVGAKRHARSVRAPIESAVDGCARELRERIVSGKFEQGTRLPAERALAERFGVGRTIMRAALIQLDAEKLVSVRQGSGYTVHDFRRVSASPDLIGALIDLAGNEADEAAIFRDLLLVRRQLARVVLERLFEKIEEKGLIMIERAIDRFEGVAASHEKERATATGTANLAAADLDIVAELVAATGSIALQVCLNPIASVVGALPKLQAAMYREPQSNVVAYRAALAWLKHPSQRGLDLLLSQLEQRDEQTVSSFRRSRR